MKFEETTDKIIQAFYKVYNTLGYGFLEKVYQNAMYVELVEMGLEVEAQKSITVEYKGRSVGEFFADIVVDKLVVVELKAVETLSVVHEIQLRNYLKATQLEIGLLFNFGKKPEFKRKLYANARKIE